MVFKCVKCSVIKKTKAQFEKHSAAHKCGILYCKVCKKSYNDKNHLVEHEDKHTKEHRYTCKETVEDVGVCNKTYQLQGSIRTHMRNAHNKPLLASNYHTKDEKDLTYETLQEYQKCTAKKTSIIPYTVNDA